MRSIFLKTVSGFAFLFLNLIPFCLKADVRFTLSFPEPQTHYVKVEMEVDARSSELEIRMPVWAPGSYLVRDFSRNLEQLEATDASGKKATIVRTAKNGWKLTGLKPGRVKVSYQVYAFELTVRTSFIDAEHAYLNGTSIFLFSEPAIKEKQIVKVIPHSSWKKMSVALDPVNSSDPWVVSAPDYDVLVDSPFEIGNHTVLTFISAQIPHEVALFGEANYDGEKLKRDIGRIVEECTAIFGSNPCKRYLFIVHNLPSGGGGLEHLNSTTLQTGRWSYGSEGSYNGFLSLVAHEYFHLWNVKRLRPMPLGPFDYNAENYTSLLWIAEGFTAYYDDLIVRRCGFTSENEYLKTLAGNISYSDNIRGREYQTLAESSFDAWIKYYKPSENSNNSTVSYYTRGAALGALLDLSIRRNTKGIKSLDDVFREMYNLYFLKLNRVYTEQEFIDMVNKVSGMNYVEFFAHFARGIDKFDFRSELEAFGLQLRDLNAGAGIPWLGINTNMAGGKLNVSSIDRGSPAWKAGVNVNDELIAVDQYRLSDDLSKFLNGKRPGDKISLLISRNGYVQRFEITLDAGPFVKYSIEKSAEMKEEQRILYKSWLKAG
jgi:predicted metalloprotease with PDZ domain